MTKRRAMVAQPPVVIDDTNLSSAWARLLLRVLDGAGTEVAPLVLSISGFNQNGKAAEDPAVRGALDDLLTRKGRVNVEDVAFTIFPERIWKMSRGDRKRLFALYCETLPRWKAINRTANGRGLYFERMVMYGRGPCDGNQLEWILSQFNSRKGVRRSMLQAATFDPGRDHVASAQLGFPCLDHVSFVPTRAGLVVNASYATQQIFDKAYGNYLGLARLGAFMAEEMSMPLARVNVMVGVAKLERVKKSDSALMLLVAAARALLSRSTNPDGHAPVPIATAEATSPSAKSPRVRGTHPQDRAPKAGSSVSNASWQMDMHAPDRPPAPATVAKSIFLRHLAPAKVSEVYNSYWRFAAERQAVFFRRVRGEPPPWTDDPVLAIYKFTNAYRASDRVSQYLIRHVIYRDDLPKSPGEVFFRVLLFKLFNKVETWELLERSVGPLTFEDYSFAAYDSVLTRALQTGGRIYSAAYIMPPGTRAFGHSAKHQNHLLLLELMMSDQLADRLASTRTMQEGFEQLRAYPTIGDFLAYQFITDINYSELTNFSEMEFVVPGPGARDGLRKCFSDPGGLNEPEIIQMVADLQEREFQRLELDFETLWGRRLQLIDCQNLFCEVDKYARVAHPEISGRTGRTRIKQKFVPTSEPMKLYYPPKWDFNQRIREAAMRGPVACDPEGGVRELR